MFGLGRGETSGANTPRLEPKHLFEKRVARDNARLRAYNQLLGQIHSRIYHTSQISGTANYVIYTVPPFILGLPALDMQDCIVYLVHMLRTSGFEVRFTYPNLLYISWKHYERDYNMSQNPITKAMMPPASSTSKKGKEGGRGMDGASLPSVTFAPASSGSGSGGGPALAPPRSAIDYQPPDAFVQGITRPPPRPQPLGNGVPNGNAAAQTSNDVLAELWKFT
jgi:hypothetical protein